MNKTTAIIFMSTALIFAYTNSTANYTLFHQAPVLKIPPHSYLTKIIQRKQPRLTKAKANQIARAIYKHSKYYKLPPILIIALSERESSLLPKSTSKKSCIGLMQINPRAHPNKVKNFSRDRLYDIDTNIKIGCSILKEYLTKTGTISGALQRYIGAKNKSYVNDILSSFTDEIILQQSK